MQLAGIVEGGIVLAALSGIGRGDGELGIDLVQWVLGGGESELVLEEGGLGRVPVRVRQVQALHGVQQLLGLLDKAREVEHGSCKSWGVTAPSTLRRSIVKEVVVGARSSVVVVVVVAD